MISRKHRFHGHNSLNFAYRQGKTVRSQWFSLRYVANSRRQHYRVAVVVSRKVHKSAVVRNRIRRRLYELARLELTGLDRPYDLIITVFSDQVATMGSDDLRQAFERCLQGAGLR